MNDAYDVYFLTFPLFWQANGNIAVAGKIYMIADPVTYSTSVIFAGADENNSTSVLIMA